MIVIAEQYVALFDRIGFTPEMIFTSEAIKPWRKLNDRENCTWDLPGSAHRLHVKRFPRTRKSRTLAQAEAEGYRALQSARIPAADVAAWGTLDDGRSFIATADLAGFAPADKLIESGFPFDRLLIPTADLSAALHNAGLHHRDLYLCHFFARVEPDQTVAVRLIDAARVGPLPGPFTRRRWIVKDLAQFWFSTLTLAVSDTQRQSWLARYCQQTHFPSERSLQRSITRKSNWIAAHDQRLRRKQPQRNISIPTSAAKP
jgi:Lipopolysaccharide kinase (Kdo/WaaP) family